MGIQVEFNDVLALRHYDYAEYAICEAGCVPKDLVVDSQHEFLKVGYRVMPLDKPIPLVITEGKGRFSKVLGLVIIRCVCVDKDPLSDEMKTTGVYRVSKVFNDEESDKWLKFLNTNPHPHNWIDIRNV